MRLVGVDIPDNKKVEIALTKIFGIGRKRAQAILEATKISFNKRAADLNGEELGKLRDYIESNFIIEGELKREIGNNIKILKELGAYRGLRHARNLPVRGQQTKTNARTKRGARKTVGSGRKPPAQKT